MRYRAGISAARSRGHFGDATVELIMGASLPIPSTSSGSDPLRGPSSALRRAPFMGMGASRMPVARRQYVVLHVMTVAEAGA